MTRKNSYKVPSIGQLVFYPWADDLILYRKNQFFWLESGFSLVAFIFYKKQAKTNKA
jgi:hypothetical protein